MSGNDLSIALWDLELELGAAYSLMRRNRYAEARLYLRIAEYVLSRIQQ